jgi:hypothetical protein
MLNLTFSSNRYNEPEKLIINNDNLEIVYLFIIYFYCKDLLLHNLTSPDTT